MVVETAPCGAGCILYQLCSEHYSKTYKKSQQLFSITLWSKTRGTVCISLLKHRGFRLENFDNLIDFTKPVVIEKIVQQAKAISECGLYDGIWLDHWGEGKRLQGIYTAEEEYIAKDTILQRIREVVPDDFFILVNNNRRKLQHRWAPYVNGIYMESGRDFWRLVLCQDYLDV